MMRIIVILTLFVLIEAAVIGAVAILTIEGII